MPLHEPDLTCKPLVKVLPEQKLMKLAVSLNDLSTYFVHEIHAYVAELT